MENPSPEATVVNNVAPAPEPRHVMVDIETLGRRPYCPILSLGACTFRLTEQPGQALPINIVVEPFYQAITLESCLELGLKVDADTLLWWMQQSEDARRAAFMDEKAVKLPQALDAFTDFLNSRPLSIWGNSARFDLGLLEAAYTACGKRPPWNYRDERCYRTIKNLPEARGIECPRYGTHHNALDDAISQALHLHAINERLHLQL